MELVQRIKHKLAQTKAKMNETQEPAVTDHLWPEIEILNWVCAESHRAFLDRSAKSTFLLVIWYDKVKSQTSAISLHNKDNMMCLSPHHF
jgi:hypothetical protein